MGMEKTEVRGNLSAPSGSLNLLCAFCYLKRGLRSKLQPGARRMRAIRSNFYGTMWRAAANATGSQFRVLSGNTGEISRGERVLQVSDNRISLDDPATLARAADKLAIHKMLAQEGIRVPRQIALEVNQFADALEMLRTSQLPLVIKPAANTGAGAGVSTNVRTLLQLRDAVAWARAYGPRVLVEEQIDGDCYRILVMAGEVLDTVIRHPPKVIGDGVATIRQLIRRENLLRRGSGAIRAQVLIRIDPDLRNTLNSQGLNPGSRPEKDSMVLLKRVINDNGTTDNVAANGVLCPAIIESARKAADVIGARLAGIDLICRDPGVPLEDSGGAVIEVNANPGLYYHYRPADSRYRVAENVLTRFFNSSWVPSSL
jgi:D-alanine-D-alanine ligase-like ATP-grasp enzyme